MTENSSMPRLQPGVEYSLVFKKYRHDYFTCVMESVCAEGKSL